MHSGGDVTTGHVTVLFSYDYDNYFVRTTTNNDRLSAQLDHLDCITNMAMDHVFGFGLTFRHRASCILGQAFHYSPENAFYIFNKQIYFVI